MYTMCRVCRPPCSRRPPGISPTARLGGRYHRGAHAADADVPVERRTCAVNAAEHDRRAFCAGRRSPCVIRLVHLSHMTETKRGSAKKGKRTHGEAMVGPKTMRGCGEVLAPTPRARRLTAAPAGRGRGSTGPPSRCSTAPRRRAGWRRARRGSSVRGGCSRRSRSSRRP